jgi:hypothetical protein
VDVEEELVDSIVVDGIDVLVVSGVVLKQSLL